MTLGRRLVVGLGAVGLMWLSSAAHAGTPMEGVLEGNTTTNATPWQTVYLMAEAAADARVVGPLNRGARVTIDPDRSSDQYWYVELSGGPASFKGYVWKDFVKVVEMAELPGTTPAKTAKKGARPEPTASVAPMAPSLAEKDPTTRRKAPKLAPAAPIAKKDAKKKDDMWVAYDPELFEVDDGKNKKPVEKPAALEGDEAPPVTRAKALPPEPAPVPRAAKPLPPEPAPIVHVPARPAPVPEPPPAPMTATPVSEGVVEMKPAKAEAPLASPLKQIQELREQIERELESAPQTALSEQSAQNVDALMTRLNELLKVERSIVKYLESTSQMVEAHDRRIQELTGKVATLSAKGSPERSTLSDEITKMRKRLDELSTSVSSTRAQAKRIDALEARLRGDEAPVGGLRSIESALEGADHGAIVLGEPADKRKPKAEPAPEKPAEKKPEKRAEKKPEKKPVDAETTVDVQFDRRAEDLEAKLYNVKKKASDLQKAVDDDVDLPAIDARQVERESRESRDREVAEGVVEVRDREGRARNIPPNGTVAAMLNKLRDLREQRRVQREASERKRRGIAEDTELPAEQPAPKTAKAKPEPVEEEINAEPEARPDPAPARASADDEEQAPKKAPASAPAKKSKMTDDQAKNRLMEIESLISGRL